MHVHRDQHAELYSCHFSVITIILDKFIVMCNEGRTFMDVIIIITAGIIIIVLTLLKEQLGDKTLLFFTSTLCYIKLPK